MSNPLPSRVLFPWHTVLLLVGGALTASGLCCSAALVAPAISPAPGAAQNDAIYSWSFLLLIVLPMLITGGAALWLGWRQLLLRRTADLHHRVLHIADHAGSVTAADVARELMLPITTAEQLLDQLAGSGICRMEMNPDGTTRFVFPRRVIQ